MLKLKFQYFGHLMQRANSLEKTLRHWRQKKKGAAEDKMVEWHHRLNGHEFEWTPGVCDGQGGLACCDSWGHKESDTTERLNWTELHGFKTPSTNKERKAPRPCFKWGKEGHWACSCLKPRLPLDPCPICGIKGHWKVNIMSHLINETPCGPYQIPPLWQKVKRN